MEEQQARLQREIDNLRKQLENNNNLGHMPPSEEVQVYDTNGDDTVILENDDVEMLENSDNNTVPSPQPKRPKRSKSHNRKGRGGPTPAINDRNE